MKGPSEIRLAALVERNYRKNRTIVSSDIESILQDIGAECGITPIIHRFASGSDVGTWIVPPRWDVKEAWLEGPDGRRIASYADHPLFVAPYSIPFSGIVDRDELIAHTRYHQTQTDAFYYEHRLAYDYRRRLKEWIITLPKDVVDTLPDGKYRVHLDIDIGPGEMLVGEYVLEGASPRSVALLTDYCHPGQVNDSFSGILAMIDVFRRLADQPHRRYTYRFLVFPETIGSIALLHSRPDYRALIDVAIFSEFVGWGRTWRALARDDSTNLGTLLAREAACHFEPIEVAPLFGGYGNDELVFDFAGVPSLSVQMVECDEYHSSNDAPDRLRQDDLDFASEVILRMCRVLEQNQRWTFTQEVPFYMTRYGLYADSIHQQDEFRRRRAIMYGLRRGKSPLEISIEDEVPFDYVVKFIDSAAAHGLVRPVDETSPPPV